MPEKPAPVCPLNKGHLNATIRSTPSANTFTEAAQQTLSNPELPNAATRPASSGRGIETKNSRAQNTSPVKRQERWLRQMFFSTPTRRTISMHQYDKNAPKQNRKTPLSRANENTIFFFFNQLTDITKTG
jgi:hypothetical protein